MALKDAHGAIRVLAVGVNTYPTNSAFGSLQNGADDAFQMAATFREVQQLNADPKHIALMTSATIALPPHRGLIFKKLHELTADAAPDERLLFYFSGHGHRIEGVDDHFLVPQDAGSETKVDTLVSLKEVFAILKASPAKQKILVLDICLSGPGRLGEGLPAASPADEFFASHRALTKGLTILAANVADAISYAKSPNPKLSLFTYHLINGLRGHPDALDEQLLTLAKLFAFVSTEVKQVCNSYRIQQVPSPDSSATGIIVLGDFRPTLTASASVNLKGHPFKALVFHESKNVRTKEILTQWTDRFKTKDQLEYAVNNKGGLEKYLEESFAEWRPTFRRSFGFTASQIDTSGTSFTFPGGSLNHCYHAASKDSGRIHRELSLDPAWFDDGCRLELLLSKLNFAPDSFELTLTGTLKPMDQIAGLEAHKWVIHHETSDRVEGGKGGVTMTINKDSLIFEGFNIKDLLTGASGPNQERQLLEETIGMVAPQE